MSKESAKQQLNEMIAHYEAAREEKKSLYLDADQFADIADEYVRQGRADEAFEVAETGLKMHPGHETLLTVKVSIFLDENKLKEARDILESIQNNNSVDIQILNIELLILEEKASEAQAMLDKLDEMDLESENCQDIAYMCMDMEYNTQALYWIRKAYSLSPENKEIRIASAECFLVLGANEEAIDIYNRLLDENPYAPEYWLGISKGQFNLFNYNKAAEAAEFAIVANDTNGEAYYARAQALLQLENYEAAIKDFETAVEKGGVNTQLVHMFIGFAYIALGEWQKAFLQLNDVMLGAEDDAIIFPDVMLNLARCMNKLGNNEEAHKFCDVIKNSYPGHFEVYIFDGLVYLEEGNREKALENWKEAVNFSPLADTWNYIGIICLNMFEFEMAENAFEQVRRIDAEFPELDENLAYAKQGKLRNEEFQLYKEIYLFFLDKAEMDVRELLDFPPKLVAHIASNVQEVIDQLTYLTKESDSDTKESDEEPSDLV